MGEIRPDTQPIPRSPKETNIIFTEATLNPRTEVTRDLLILTGAVKPEVNFGELLDDEVQELIADAARAYDLDPEIKAKVDDMSSNESV